MFLPTFLSLASVAYATSCFDFIIPVPVKAQSYPLIFPPFKDGNDATEFLLQSSKRDAPTNASVLFSAPVPISTTFNISARYCVPSGHPHGQSGSIVQLLTHGLGFDKSYWHLDGAEYNYAAAATKAGYATLSYDRLGNGLSTLPDPYAVQQAPVQLAILVELTKLLKTGNLSPKIPKPAKIIHVGHSYGSLLSNGVAATTPELSDGVILTGFSHNTTWGNWFSISTNFHLAKENQPARFGNASTGSLTWADKYANQYAFLTYPYFDPSMLDKAEKGKFPFSIGEILSQGLVPVLSPKFKKPVLLMAAEDDLIFCGADCKGVADGPYSATPLVFSAAKPLEIYIQPNTGHGMNLHHNATGWYGVVFDFLGKNGL